jgi:hypothetical protein
VHIVEHYFDVICRPCVADFAVDFVAFVGALVKLDGNEGVDTSTAFGFEDEMIAEENDNSFVADSFENLFLIFFNTF